MENFFTMEYLIAYAGFAVMFVLYLVADNKVKNLQRKCSLTFGVVSELESVPVEDIEAQSQDNEHSALFQAVKELKYFKEKAGKVKEECEKRKK